MKRSTVLFLAASPIRGQQLRLDEEYRAIERKIRGATYRDRIHLVPQWAARPCDFLERLTDYSPSVIHFSGHGAQREGLCFVSDDGAPVPVTAKALGTAFRARSSNVKLAVLNACYSETQAEELVEHVPCVIGMPDAIQDKQAINYAANLYWALASATSVAEAHHLGIAALELDHSGGIPRDVDSAETVVSPQHVLPVLLTQSGTDPEHVYIVPRPRAATCVLTLRATLSAFDARLVARIKVELRRISDDPDLEIDDIEEGSVRLTLSLSPTAAKMLLEKQATGKLAEICGFEVSRLVDMDGASGTAVPELVSARSRVIPIEDRSDRSRKHPRRQELDGAAGFGTSVGFSEPAPAAHADVGDRARTIELFVSARPSLMRMAMRMCGNREDADDLMQDTFLRACRRPLPTSVKNPRAWFATILHHQFIDHCRSPAGPPSAARWSGVEDLIVSPPAPDDLEPAWTKFTADDIHHALEALEPKYREVYALHTFERRSYEEIAEKLGVARITVGTRLNRARKKLRDILMKRFSQVKDESNSRQVRSGR